MESKMVKYKGKMGIFFFHLTLFFIFVLSAPWQSQSQKKAKQFSNNKCSSHVIDLWKEQLFEGSLKDLAAVSWR